MVGQLVDESELKESFNFRGVGEVGFGFFELGIAEGLRIGGFLGGGCEGFEREMYVFVQDCAFWRQVTSMGWCLFGWV